MDFKLNESTKNVSEAELKTNYGIIGDAHAGKCHTRCEIYKKASDCIMPREGIFAKIIKGGLLKVGDEIEVNYD